MTKRKHPARRRRRRKKTRKKRKLKRRRLDFILLLIFCSAYFLTHPDDQVHLSPQQSGAALGVGLISMGEDIGAQMAMRTFAHLVSIFFILSFIA